MKPALEKFLIIAGSLAAIGIFVFIGVWGAMKEKKQQMDDQFNNTNPPTGFVVPGQSNQPQFPFTYQLPA